MKNIILAGMASIGFTGMAFADETRTLEIPELCGTTQLGAQTIIHCTNASQLPTRNDYTSIGNIKIDATGDSVNGVLEAIPFPIKDGEAIGLDIDGDDSEDIEIGIHEGVPYIYSEGVYGVINQTYNCISSISDFGEELLICRSGVKIPNEPLYDCVHGLNDQGYIALDNNEPIRYREDNYSLCIKKGTSI